MRGTINRSILKELNAHLRGFGLKYALRGLPYERCAELTRVIEYLQPRFNEQLQYLDIGSGESPLPTFLYGHSRWNVTCLDKFGWVKKQLRFADVANGSGASHNARFQVIQSDLFEAELPTENFDVVTCISVIEHFEGNADSSAMKVAAGLLRPGGTMILSTPVNDPYSAEFFIHKTVYGTKYHGEPVFYQRHYDVESVAERLIRPSGLVEKERVYFGDYGFQCFERVLQLPKPLRVFYAWSTPTLAARFLTYRPHPVSRIRMRMNTASGVLLVLEKPALDGKRQGN